jgi:arylsulfatase A-like enzyme
MNWIRSISTLLLFIFIFIFLGMTVWGVKLFLYGGGSTMAVKAIVLLSVTAISILFTWKFHNRQYTIEQNITPLVWLFGSIFFLSIFIVSNAMMGKGVAPRAAESTRSTKENKRQNILLVTFDTLRAEDMSVYGYRKETAPFMDEWAQEATVFSRAEASSTYTAPTTTSLMTGKRVWTHQNYHQGSSFNGRGETLPSVLKKNGYYIMAYIQNPFASVKHVGISDAVDVAPQPSKFRIADSLLGLLDKTLYSTFGDKILLYDWITKRDFILYGFINKFSKDVYVTTYPTERVFHNFLSDLDKDPPEPFFAWLHLNPPHDPYLPPAGVKRLFNSSPKLLTLKSQLIMRRFSVFPEERKHLVSIFRDRYDEFIRYCDQSFKDFIHKFNEKSVSNNTLIILSADHGESFEHGVLYHNNGHIYEQMTHIPLIIREVGQSEARTVDHLVEQIDIPATILDLVNIPVPHWMEGRSLTPLMRGKRLPHRLALSMYLEKNKSLRHPINRGAFAIWDGDYKFILYLGRKESLLFNLKDDPGELHNIIGDQPDIAVRLKTLILSRLKKANEEIVNKSSKE